MYFSQFSGSEFHNKFSAMSGIFKTKKEWFRKEDKHTGSNRKQIFFGAKAKFFGIQSNVNSTSRSIFGNPLTKFGNLLEQTMSSLENMIN